jgi:hypothetical protein
MLQTIGDWYRIIDLNIADDFLEKRRLAASSLADEWTKATPDTVAEIVSYACDLFSADRKAPSPLYDEIVKAIQQAQPSFDTHTKTVTADVRICCAVALNELMYRQRSTRRPVGRTSLRAASCIISALRWRSTTSGIQIAACRSSLLDNAEAVLDAVDDRRRTRRDLPLEEFQRSLADENANLGTVGKIFDQIFTEMVKDREELQALWWVFGGYSNLMRVPFGSMNPSTAALLSGLELSTIIKAPATYSLASLSGRAVCATPNADTHSPINSFFESVTGEAWQQMTLSARTEAVVRRHPIIFPLSYISVRHCVDGSKLDEIIKTLPDWGTMEAVKPAEMAMQFFAERILLDQIEDK